MTDIPEVDATSDAVVSSMQGGELLVTFQLSPEAAREYASRLVKAAIRVERVRDNKARGVAP